ncbi:hypothetical protein [Cupriavidus necator]
MSRKSITALPNGHYWATPHAPFALDCPNGHDEIFPGAQCFSDGKWVTFYKGGEEVWACNAVSVDDWIDDRYVNRAVEELGLDTAWPRFDASGKIVTAR